MIGHHITNIYLVLPLLDSILNALFVILTEPHGLGLTIFPVLELRKLKPPKVKVGPRCALNHPVSLTPSDLRE